MQCLQLKADVTYNWQKTSKSILNLSTFDISTYGCSIVIMVSHTLISMKTYFWISSTFKCKSLKIELQEKK